MIRDLFLDSSPAWDGPLIRSLFPSSVHSTILAVHIPPFEEQDSLVWAASTTGKFSVRSAYRVLHQSSSTYVARSGGGGSFKFWNSLLHPHHQLLLWRILSGSLATKDRLKNIIPITHAGCEICGFDEESLAHLFMHCPLAVALWANSPWQLRLDRPPFPSLSAWISDLLSSCLTSIPPGVDPDRFLHFVVVAWETIWRTWNDIRHSTPCPDWGVLCHKVNSASSSYWNASFNRGKHLVRCDPGVWVPPRAGWLKFNVDAAILGDRAWSACLLRNHLGESMGAWVSVDVFSNVFAAELKAFLLAFHAGDDLQSQKLLFEGDALGVV